MVTVVDRTTVRHPEKARRPDAPVMRKPDWIRVRAPGSPVYRETQEIVKKNGLVTVCEEAGCPNIGECWSKKHATFMIMGDTCTRACAFCNVRTGLPAPLDTAEPAKVGDAVAKLGLEHVVVTSVDRDDLADGGANHMADTIRAIRAAAPGTTIEVLTPDFLRKPGALETVVDARPDVFNHNLETVPSLYLQVRPGARYYHSIRLLDRVKMLDPTIFTKSGIMVGLGEMRNEVLQLMDDLRAADVDFLTIGQYLQPTRKHYPVKEYVHARDVQGVPDHRDRQGLPDGVGLAADAVLLPRGRRLRAPEAPRREARQTRRYGARLMPEFETTRRVKHSVDNMFDLVADVHGLSALRAAVQIADGAPARHAAGRARGARGGDDGRLQVHPRDVHLAGGAGPREQRDRRDVSRRAVQGAPQPLDLHAGRRLDDRRPLLDPYEFKSRTLAAVMGQVFDHAFRRFASAFEERADKVYGLPAPS